MNPRRHLLSLAALLAAFALSGCVSAKYKPAKKDTPPPLPLNLTAAQPTVEATVNTVIVYKGPGSWKREAYWDEYVLTLANRGGVPLVVESASLTDFRGDATGPGDNPWLLEKQSRTWAADLNRTVKGALVQLGGGLVIVSIGGGVVAASLGVGAAAGGLGAAAGGFAVGMAGVAILPFYIGGAIYRNVSSRHDIEAEFARRRLVLPATIAASQTAQGSLFFRISPGPQRLVLRGRAGDQPVEVVVDLAPLKGLHLQAPAAAGRKLDL